MIVSADIGATNISLAKIRSSGEIEAHKRFLTPKGISAKEFLEFFLRSTKSIVSSLDEVEGFGVGVCGVVRDGTIVFSPNACFRNLPLKEGLEQKFCVPVAVLNDADAFALGVFHYEFAGRFESVCAITLGTGLGGAMVSSYGLFQGFGGMSPEIGHITLVANGRLCGCGKRGCFEAYANEKALLTEYRLAHGKKSLSTAKELFALFRGRDKSARRAFERYGYFLGVGLSSIANVFTPQVFILGGGISKAKSAFLPALEKSLRENLISGLPIKPRVIFSAYQRKASLLGAFYQVKAMIGI